ncbi:uncharacterized protein LOC130495600 [Raphanus sativus]|uniref:chorismate mutase n=1 Tax=Raphanus sativus TaxID=3726 RepID=A0A9W3BUZ1_RAPSA|nr:uncharacterized protein LOC130495600 [Raphanus sativus]
MDIPGLNAFGPKSPSQRDGKIYFNVKELMKEALVADAISASNWALPNPRSEQEVTLHSYLTTISLPLPIDVSDVFEWRAADFPLNEFNSRATWEVLRPRQPIQDWHDVVWFKGALPKHAFTMWVANYDRLPTRARLASWNLLVPATCPLCASHAETRDHLFLSCRYANDIWSYVFARCNPPPRRFTEWSELLSWIRATHSRRLQLLRKLASQAVIFHIWKQRNNLIHNNDALPASTVFRSIDKEMKNIISSRRSQKVFSSLMDKDALMDMLTFLTVEEAIKKRVEIKTRTYGQEVKVGRMEEKEEEEESQVYKISPILVGHLYGDWIMPLTKEVQVEYLLRRLD